MATLIIPTPLRKFTDQQASIKVDGATVQAAVDRLIDLYPALKQHLLDQEGNIRAFVRIFLEDEDILALDGPNTAVQADSTLSIIPAIAGGVEL
ncbi:MoaD/ThiS family protein [Saprospira sp. CCB-QB6]|uniref:MoaD/ThiS family protein n=1 Tax=Saprospira sp. CCB-QB6 TaxID=3023936 RepID=UPI00234B1592|nr:MoaD/ThiS family protein [Saprospira sp. CCB-QB6]WCL82948.1 MoaD/ThiS family protein [Saprospira sp. CCB-QB6]